MIWLPLLSKRLSQALAMTDAFLETTVLTDYLLKKDGSEVRAKAAFARYDRVTVSNFSWKEFKRGPLKNFVWAHNKVVETGSFSATLIALQRLSLTPQRYMTATAIQSIQAFSSMFIGTTPQDFFARYDKRADMDAMLADAMRLELKQKIYLAWAGRKNLFGGSVQPLSCYPDQEIVEKNGRIDLSPRDCPNGVTCCLQASLISRPSELAAARSSLDVTSEKRETVRRRDLLRQLEKHPARPMERKECQIFGDAYFVFFCPNAATILTTNLGDIQPMADALGVSVARP